MNLEAFTIFFASKCVQRLNRCASESLSGIMVKNPFPPSAAGDWYGYVKENLTSFPKISSKPQQILIVWLSSKEVDHERTENWLRFIPIML